MKDLTLPERILQAAHSLATKLVLAGLPPEFSEEDLAVVAHQLWPKEFGLIGYHDRFLDNNKVRTILVGKSGLVARGFFQKTGKVPGRKTRGKLKLIWQPESQPQAQAAEGMVSLTDGQKRFLLAILSSVALKKFETGRKPEMTFADACQFWGIAATHKGDEIGQRLAKTTDDLTEIQNLLAVGDAELPGGRIVGAGDIRVLGHVHAYLVDRFDRHLNILAVRSEANGESEAKGWPKGQPRPARPDCEHCGGKNGGHSPMCRRPKKVGVA